MLNNNFVKKIVKSLVVIINHKFHYKLTNIFKFTETEKQIITEQINSKYFTNYSFLFYTCLHLTQN